MTEAVLFLVMLISSLTKFQNQYYVEYDQHHILTAHSVSKENMDAKGKLVGIHKLLNRFYRMMCEDYAGSVDRQSKLIGMSPRRGYRFVF